METSDSHGNVLHIVTASAIPTVNSTTFRSFLGCRDYPPIILKPTDTRPVNWQISLAVFAKKGPWL